VASEPGAEIVARSRVTGKDPLSQGVSSQRYSGVHRCVKPAGNSRTACTLIENGVPKIHLVIALQFADTVLAADILARISHALLALRRHMSLQRGSAFCEDPPSISVAL